MTLLVEWLWQGVVLAVAARALLHFVPYLTAATRHTAWWITLLAVMVVPLAWSVVGGDVLTITSASPLAGSAHRAIALELAAPPRWAVVAGLVGWCLASAAGLASVLRGYRALRRLRSSAAPFEPERAGRLPAWTAASQAGRRARLCVSDHVRMPCALGLGEPVVLLPRSLESLPDEDLDLIVAHEHTHLARYDDLWRLVQVVIGAFASWHPAMHLIGAQIDLEREAACDEEVVRRTGSAHRYATSLARAAALVASGPACGGRVPALAPMMSLGRSTLRVRVERLLQPVRASRRGATLALLSCAVVLAGITIALAAAPHVVVFGPEELRPSIHAALVASQRSPLFTTAVASSPRTEAPLTDERPRKGVSGGPPTGVRRIQRIVAAPVASTTPQVVVGRPPGDDDPFSGHAGQPAPEPAQTAVSAEEVIAAALLFDNGVPLVPASRAGLRSETLQLIDEPAGTPWRRLAGTGTAVGTHTAGTGLAIGGLFARAARATADVVRVGARDGARTGTDRPGQP